MLEVEARRYSDRQIERWRRRVGSYLDHNLIGEPPNVTHRHRLEGDRWLPGGLPDTGFYLAAGHPCGYHIHVPINAVGVAVFGIGIAAFAWQELAVLDETGQDVWTGQVDLGTKRAEDVWLVAIRPG